jgi:hypothetical protein
MEELMGDLGYKVLTMAGITAGLDRVNLDFAMENSVFMLPDAKLSFVSLESVNVTL